jgi:6-phosphogluconolactonase (cycloisomerase 2 family)
VRLFVSLLMITVGVSIAGCRDKDNSVRLTVPVGGSITGLSGTATVVLNDTEELTLSQDGVFQFRTRLAGGQSYSITLGAQPPDQTCTVSNGSGTVTSASNSNVTVTCTTRPQYAIGGAISGLSGTVELQHGSDVIAVSSNGRFTFPTRVEAGESYAVSVVTQPTGAQCDVASGSGVVASQDVEDVAVSCRALTHALGGVVSGLNGTLTLNQNGETLTVNSDGPFTFSTPVAEGETFAVTIQVQPIAQACTVTNGTGTMPASDVSEIAVSCVAALAAVGGTVSGLVSGYESDVVLELNGGDTLAVSSDGTFEFPTPLAVGSAYAVTIAAQPRVPRRNCSLTNGAGIVPQLGVTNVTVTCEAPVPRLAFVTGLGSSNVRVYSIDSTTGALSFRTADASTSDAFQSAVTPDGRFFYVPEWVSGYILGYAVDANGALSPLRRSPYAAMPGARALSITPDGKFLYVIGELSNRVAAFAVDPSTGDLSPLGSQVVVGLHPVDVAITPNGKYLYIASFEGQLVGYEINDATGELASIGAFGIGASVARSITVDPRGKFVYVPTHPGAVAVLGIDADTGALSHVAGSPFATGGTGALAAAVDPSSRFLYVSHIVSNDVSGFSINGESGVLSPLQGSPFISEAPYGITIEPSGRFLYLASPSAQMQVFSINAATGAITLMPDATLSTAPAQPNYISIIAD